jgi:hypothetical protein
VIISWFHSDEEFVPFNVIARRSGPPSREGLVQQSDIIDLIHPHKYPVRKRATAGTADLIRKQLDRAVEYSVIMRFKNTIFLVIAQPHHAPVLDRRADLRIRLQRQHLSSFLRSQITQMPTSRRVAWRVSFRAGFGAYFSSADLRRDGRLVVGGHAGIQASPGTFSVVSVSGFLGVSRDALALATILSFSARTIHHSATRASVSR